LSSTEDNSKWKDLENEIEAEGFKRVAYQKNALGGSGEISGMSFRRDNLYINVKRETDEKGNLTDKFDVELYNSDTGAIEEQNGLSQNLAWNMAKVAAEAGTTYGKAEPAEALKEFHTGYAPVQKPRETKETPSFFPSTLDFFLRSREQKKLDEGSEGEAHEFELYRPFMNTKEIVGRSTWTLLHSIAAGLHDPPTSDEQAGITTIVRELSGVYPCIECRPGFSYIEQNPPDFSSRVAFERWLCSWHNAVSRHIGKVEIVCDSSKLHQAYQLGCEACKRVRTMGDQTALILETERNHTPLTKPESQRVVDIVVTELCSKYGVPKPKILFEENVEFCPGTSCFPPGTLVLTLDGAKPIEEIAEGNYVLSHDGVFHKVTKVFEREYTGELVSLRATGNNFALCCTPEHPLLVHGGAGRSQQYETYNVGYSLLHPRNESILAKGADWLEARSIGALDYLLSPVPRISIRVEHIDVKRELISSGMTARDFSWSFIARKGKGLRWKKASLHLLESGIEVTNDFLFVLGLYLAEGSSGRLALNFSFAKDERQLAEKIKSVIQREYGITVKIWEPTGYAGLRVDVFSSLLAKLFDHWFGRGAHKKKIPLWIFNLPDEQLSPFIEGYFAGDGFVGNSGRIYFDTVSPSIAHQLYFILLKMGKNPVLRIDKTIERTLNGRKIKGGGDHYRLVLHPPTNKRFIHRGFGYRPIHKIERTTYDGKVYNLQVEGSNSYTANGFAVHNCTIQDAKHPVETTHIYYNPSAFSLRTTAHEFYHYLASVLKPEEIKRKLGFSFQGDPDDEREADAFAFKVIEEIYSPAKVRLNRDSGIGSNGMPQQQQQELETIKVMKQELTFMGGGVNAPIFEKLSALYTMFEPYANLRAEDLNNIYSPEIFGTVFDVGYNVLLTPLGAVLSNVVSWLILAALGSQRNLAYTDRYFLSEWAAYHGTRILRLADPAYLSSTTGSARAIGRAVGSGRAQDALNQVVKNQNEIAGGFRAALNAVQEAFGAINLPKIPQINLGGITGSSSGSAQVTNVDGHGSGFN
jgi:intein/homing endonuclease